jgi:hypothetical protein
MLHFRDSISGDMLMLSTAGFWLQIVPGLPQMAALSVTLFIAWILLIL